MKHKPIPNQLAFELFEQLSYTPGNCPHETATVDIGGGKSFCEPWQTWTNCREVSHCVYEQFKGRI